jgi:hypothetical protein
MPGFGETPFRGLEAGKDRGESPPPPRNAITPELRFRICQETLPDPHYPCLTPITRIVCGGRIWSSNGVPFTFEESFQLYPSCQTRQLTFDTSTDSKI